MEHFYNTIGEDWFTYQELYSNMVEYFPDNSLFIEVGSWKGRSTSYMAVEIANSEKNIKFDCIDTWNGLLKIDIEGSEWEVLDSTPNTIFECIDKFLLEYHLPKGRLQNLITRMHWCGFQHWFEPGFNEENENGTVLFFK